MNYDDFKNQPVNPETREILRMIGIFDPTVPVTYAALRARLIELNEQAACYMGLCR